MPFAMTKRPKTKPLSVRFTAEERAQLERKAGRLSLGEFVRKCVLDDSVSSHRKQQPLPRESIKILAKILAMLGRTNQAKSLATFAEAAKLGTLPLTGETEALIRKACRDIAIVKRLLMQALRIKED